MIGTAYFLGWAISSIIWPFLPANIGLKPFVTAGYAATVVIQSCELLTGNLNILIMLNFLDGLTNQLKQQLAVVYFGELVPEQYTYIPLLMFGFFTSSIPTCGALFFRYIANDWVYFQLLCILGMAICTGF